MKIMRVVLKRYFDSEDIVKEKDHVVVIFNDPAREYDDDVIVRTLDGKVLGSIPHEDDGDTYRIIHNLHYGTIEEITERTYTISMNIGEVIKLEKFPEIQIVENLKEAYQILQTQFPKAVEFFKSNYKQEEEFYNILRIIESIDEYYALQFLDSNYARELNLVRIYFTIPMYHYLKMTNPDWYKEGMHLEESLGAFNRARYMAHKKFIEEHGDYDYCMKLKDDDLLSLK